MCCGLCFCGFIIFLGFLLETLVYTIVISIQFCIAPTSTNVTLTALPIARCFFSHLLSATSYLLYIFVFLRWLQVYFIIESGMATHKQNLIALIVGLLASTGVNILGNYTFAEVPAMYLVGSFLGFGLGSVYQLIMYKISRSIRHLTHIPSWLYPVKLILGIISFVMFISMYSFSGASIFFFGGLDHTKWKKTNRGRELHAISLTTQRICTISSNLYLLSMAADFQHFKVKADIFRVELV